MQRTHLDQVNYTVLIVCYSILETSQFFKETLVYETFKSLLTGSNVGFNIAGASSCPAGSFLSDTGKCAAGLLQEKIVDNNIRIKGLVTRR
jgi:hypothetical protein